MFTVEGNDSLITAEFFLETRQLLSALLMALETASEDEVVLTSYFLLSRYSLPTAGIHLKNVIVKRKFPLVI